MVSLDRLLLRLPGVLLEGVLDGGLVGGRAEENALGFLASFGTTSSSSVSCQSFFLMLSFLSTGWNSGSTATSPAKLTFFIVEPKVNDSSFSSSMGLCNATLQLRICSLTRSFRSAFFPVMGIPNFLQAFFKLPTLLLSMSLMKFSPIGDAGELGTATVFFARRGDRRLPLDFLGVGSYSLSSPPSSSMNDSSLSNASES
mmetsp:Transcript_19814/g.43001  ORF Transcript_19814/g.43001 Transcript_19814/m.43001 type:complete len:200 (-) Transcript_19814:2373-2972(-)